MAGELYLIRHGQASFMQDNYDRLSELGRKQANVVGEYLVNNQFTFDACLSGSLERHQKTFAGILESYQNHNTLLSQAEIHTELNEHQAAEIHQQYLPKILEKPEYHPLKSLVQTHGHHHPEVRKAFLKLFFKSTQDWVEGKIPLEGFESFVAFKQRVEKAYELLIQVMEAKARVLVISSGGTIAMLMGILLEISDHKVIELNWQIRNCSITEFSYSKGKFYLRGFNQVAHFDQNKQELLTYV